MKKQLIAIGVGSVLLVGGVALASTQTGDDNGHGDKGCHKGDHEVLVLDNKHCVKDSPSPSVSPSDTPDVTPSPSASPSPSPSPSSTPEVTQKVSLPDVGGHGTLHP